MSTRMTIVLSKDEAEALTAIARDELREPRDQLRLLLREELSRRGLLVSTASEPLPDRLSRESDEARRRPGRNS